MLLSAVVVLILLSACRAGGKSEIEAATIQGRLGDEVSLKFGQGVYYEEADLEVRFEAVVNDSRCPKKVVCAWAGEARVTLALRQGALEPSRFDVVYPDVPPIDGLPVDRYQVKLLGVDPYPEDPQTPIPAESYSVRLVVR